jgi:L-alanine-DL-glutamate epimerase-like enolase superfamily enzyme
MKITRVQAAECKLPIANPIRLGPVEIHTRDFVALRLETDAGLWGDAISYPRGSALLESVAKLAPHIIGTEVQYRRRTIDGVLQRFVNGRAGFIKAASLLDIALWDLAAKEIQQPLYWMLGGRRSQVPVMAVAGYYLDSRSLDDVIAEVKLLVNEGYQRIKVMISGANPEFDEQLIEAAKAVAGKRLCADAHWAFRNVADAYETCRRLEKYDLTFIEDPFAPYQTDLNAELQRLLRTPLAYGEDLPDAQTLHRAIDSTQYLRLDATTCGGVSLAIASAEEAGIRGRSVLPHVFLPLHAQLAGSLQAIEAVEYIPISTRACPMFDLLTRTPKIEAGMLTIDQAPGAGFELDWSRVERTKTSSFCEG